jgi:Zn-dependent protease
MNAGWIDTLFILAASQSKHPTIDIPKHALNLITDPQFRISAIIMLVGLVASVLLHEIAHAYTAHWMGDPTPKEHGRLTFNPIPHFKSDIIFMLVIPVVTWFMYQGWWALAGGHCPVNPSRMRHPRFGHFLVSFAGPGVMLAIALLCALVLMIPSVGFVNAGYNIRAIPFGIYLVGYANVILAVFNLLPIPPMDGANMLASVIPSLQGLFMKLGNSVGMVLIILVGWPLMNYIWGPVENAYVDVITSGFILLGG